MSVLTRTTALTAAGALLAVPAAVLVAAPAQADTERQGACGTGSYEFSVDRERNGFEIDANLDNVTPGTTWKVVLRHDGKRYVNRTLTADSEGELEVGRFRANTPGKDTFVFKATQVGGGGACKSVIVSS